MSVRRKAKTFLSANHPRAYSAVVRAREKLVKLGLESLAAWLDIDQYIGGDIVEAVIADNATKYADQTRRFMTLDIMNDELPAVDLILCRDCLVHLSFHDIAEVIHNFKRSDCAYLLTTTFTEQAANKDIQTGEWRPVNLQKAPFNFPEPIKLIHENQVVENGLDKCLGLWRISDLP